MSSDSGGASVQVSGHALGRTPAELHLATGEHQITLHLDGYADAIRSVTLEPGGQANINAYLWLWTPQAQLLRPTFPGAAIAEATFLTDGRIALTVVLPPDDERQTWLLDDDDGMRRLGPTEARGPLAVTLDGGRVAYGGAWSGQ